MPNSFIKDSQYLISIIDSIEKIENYTKKFENVEDFYNDSITFDATMMNFIIIGEMAHKLSDDFKLTTINKIDWPKVKGFRNIIAHNYFGIDAEEVWQIIQGSLKSLKKEIKKIVK